MTRRTPHDRSLSVDDSGVSRQVSFLLSFTMATILIGGLITAAGGLVEDRTEQAAETRLRVAGDQLAAQLMAADRIQRRQPGADFVIDPRVSARAAGSQYNVEIRVGTEDVLVLTSAAHDVTVEVPMELPSSTTIEETEVTSGDFVIRYDASTATGVVLERGD